MAREVLVQPRVNLVQAARSAPSHGSGISPSTASGAVLARLRPKRERILVVGDTVTGKSYAWFRLARRKRDEAIAAGTPIPQFYMLDTDDTAPKFMNDGDEFEDLYVGNGGNIHPYPSFTYDDTRTAAGAIFAKATANDWIVGDVVNRIYTQAQQYIAEKKGFNLEDRAFERAIASKGFGAFGPDEWMLVNQAFDAIIDTAIFHSPANLILLQHVKDMIDVPGRKERRELMLIFDQLRLKPDGAPKIPGKMDTIIMLWSVRQVYRDEKRVRTDAKTVRSLMILKDRGIVGDTRAPHDRDMFDEFFKIRNAALLAQRADPAAPSRNVIDPVEAAKIVAEAEKEVESEVDPDSPEPVNA